MEDKFIYLLQTYKYNIQVHTKNNTYEVAPLHILPRLEHTQGNGND